MGWPTCVQVWFCILSTSWCPSSLLSHRVSCWSFGRWWPQAYTPLLRPLWTCTSFIQVTWLYYLGQFRLFIYLLTFRAFGEVELQNFNNLLVELRTLVANNRCVLFYNSSINLHIRFWGIQTLYRDMLTHWTTALTSLVLWRRRWHPSTGKLWTDQGGDLFR